MHLDEFGVNTIGNQSKPVCPKYPGLSWKTFNVFFLQPFSVQGGSHRKQQQEMWLPWMWHQTTWRPASQLPEVSDPNHSKLLKQHVYYRQNLDLKLDGGICTFVVFVFFCWIYNWIIILLYNLLFLEWYSLEGKYRCPSFHEEETHHSQSAVPQAFLFGQATKKL